VTAQGTVDRPHASCPIVIESQADGGSPL